MGVNLNCSVNNNCVQFNKDGTTPTLFVNLVVQHIFSLLPFSDLDTCRHVCKHWQKLAPVAFGVREWKKYFGIDVENASCSPISQEEIGKSMMVLIPATMSKDKFTTLMNQRGEIIDDSFKGFFKTTTKSYWIEVPIKPTEVVSGALYQDRISIVKNMGGSTPTIMEALVAHGVYHVVTRGYLNMDSILCEGSWKQEINDLLWGKFYVTHYAMFTLSRVNNNTYKFRVYGALDSDLSRGCSKLLPIKRYV